MGSWVSRPSADDSDVESPSPTAFRYPPKSGTYFGNHFIMGGEKFETPQPEQYLFGDNSDLNFLGSKPVPFPYPAPQSNEPTKTIKALINIRKETLKFVKAVVPLPPPNALSPQQQSSPEDVALKKQGYNIEFVFDCDCKCEITIMYFCIEEVNGNGVFYRSKNAKLSSTSVRFKAGANQVYNYSEHVFYPSEFNEQDLQFDFEKEIYPVVIQCVVIEGDEPRQSHTTTATVDKYSDGSYSIKPLKQKLFVDGLVYLLQEIYGIENKFASRKFNEEDVENASECVICLSENRDTLILPCRHLCLCHACADSLRYQANNCPICRAPFRALLHIRAVYRIPDPCGYAAALPSEIPLVQMNAIPGYEMVPLLEALNGPYQPSDLTMAAASLAARDAARILNTGDEEGELLPIAMTVMMVAPFEQPSGQEKDSCPDKDKSHPHHPPPLAQLRHNGSGKLTKSSSADTKASITSEPEDELHFCEAVETLPDLQEFGLGLDCIVQNPTREPSFITSLSSSKKAEAAETEDEEMQLQSIEGSPLHTTNVLTIASIDEFSDEEDTSRTRKTPLSNHRLLSGDRRVLPESAQSTPKREGSAKASTTSATNNATSLSPDGVAVGRHFRYGGGGSTARVPTSASSLPTSPNSRGSTAALTCPPSTANSASTRSSGDSFTSSSSTKQLLPSSHNGGSGSGGGGGGGTNH